MSDLRTLPDVEFEVKLPAGPLSFTQLNMYLWDPAKYHEQYIFPGGGLDMEKLKVENMKLWEKITLGGIFQDAVSVVGFNWRKKLKENGFTSRHERIMEAAVTNPDLIKFAPARCEVKKQLKFRGIPIVIKMDGWDPDKGGHILENKFGVPRTQEKVDDDLQLTYYNFGIYLETGKIPARTTLQSVNDSNGKVVQIETSRLMDDLEHVGSLVVDVAQRLSEGRYEK